MKAILITAFLLVYSSFLFAQKDKIATASVGGVRYKAIFKNNDDFVIIKAKGKVINRLNAGGIWKMKFIDFDRDGYKDLLIEYFSNTPGDNALFLYNKSMRNFTEVKNFGSFAAATRLGNTNLYYSYERAGCADMNWNSDLFKINNYKAIAIGHIAGLGCEGDKEVGVFISKVKGEKLLPIKSYPIGVIKKYKSYKWVLLNTIGRLTIKNSCSSPVYFFNPLALSLLKNSGEMPRYEAI
ncbi:hypothetical protein AAFN85_29640 [Mucilaginibacter sp. CAU 1740]|uniref:hypothetical protein n=1 Tax=Mucilaginibacter sp. CAU 1740 TaxID=3140365 RepID=UPI00325A9563